MDGDRERNPLHDDDVVRDQIGELVFDPFNPLNIEVTEKNIETILSNYGIPPKVRNINIWRRAFIHRSYVKRPALYNTAENIRLVDQPDDCMPLRTKSNERLEFVGDGVLECITKYYLYRRFPKADEGFMTEKKIALVKNEHIGRLAYEMGLHKWYIISKHAEEKKIRTNLKKLGCLFEAFLGALFLEYNKLHINDEEKWFENVFVTGAGFQMAQKFVEAVFEKHVNWTELIQNDDNYKNLLQVRVQKMFKITPDYLELDRNLETGYRTGVYLCFGGSIHTFDREEAIPYERFGSFEAIQEARESSDRLLVYLGSSEHKIKRKAEQHACQLVLEKLT